MQLRAVLSNFVDQHRSQYPVLGHEKSAGKAHFPLSNPGSCLVATSTGEGGAEGIAAFEAANPHNSACKAVFSACEAILRIALVTGSASCMLQSLRALLPDLGAGDIELQSPSIRRLLASSCAEIDSWIAGRATQGRYRALF